MRENNKKNIKSELVCDCVIPKKIHYVWFGDKDKPDNVCKCLDTWKALDGFEIIEWNEKNFDVNMHPFTKNAFFDGKWAHLSDFVRAWVLYNYGGIYIDTDMCLIKNDKFLPFLDNKVFCCFEGNGLVCTSIFGATPKHHFFKDMLDYFDCNKIDYSIPNSRWVTQILVDKYNCKPNNTLQVLHDDIKIYERDLLCVPSVRSVAIHMLHASWVDNLNISDKVGRALRQHSSLYAVRAFYSVLVKIRSLLKS